MLKHVDWKRWRSISCGFPGIRLIIGAHVIVFLIRIVENKKIDIVKDEKNSLINKAIHIFSYETYFS